MLYHARRYGDVTLIELKKYKILEATEQETLEYINNRGYPEDAQVFWVYVYPSTMEPGNKHKHHYKDKSNAYNNYRLAFSVEGIVYQTYERL